MNDNPQPNLTAANQLISDVRDWLLLRDVPVVKTTAAIGKTYRGIQVLITAEGVSVIRADGQAIQYPNEQAAYDFIDEALALYAPRLAGKGAIV